MDLFSRFLYSSFEFQKNESLLKSKFKLLNSILLITVIFSTIFAVLSDLGMHDIGHIQAKVNYVCVFLSLIVIFYLRLSKENYIKSAAMLLFILLITFSSVLIFVPQDEFRLIWFYVIVYIAHTLLNNYIGMLVMVTSIIIIFISNYFIELHLSQTSINTSVFGLVIAGLLLRAHINKIIDYENSLHNALESLKNSKEKVDNLNTNLEKKVKEEVEKNRLQEEQLFRHTRQAAMGEMISMIAHQWRQPLGAISSTSIDLNMQIELETFDLKQENGIEECQKYFSNGLNEIDGFVKSLTHTIDDFRNFYKPNKESDTIKLEEVCIKSLAIIKSLLINNNINVIENYCCDEKVEIHTNEMIQVILNILKNAQDNFLEKGIKEPYIKISTNDRILSICDNGGGISEDTIDKIFDPYFSTKDEKNGTGLGLYMSKIIIEEHHNGKLTVVNTDDGVCFKIEFI